MRTAHDYAIDSTDCYELLNILAEARSEFEGNEQA